MKTLPVQSYLYAVGIALACFGCMDRELRCHDHVVKDGRNHLAAAQEMEAIFGRTNVDHYISNFGSSQFTPIWNSTTYFAGRYTISLRESVAIDYSQCNLKGAVGPVSVYIWKVTKVDNVSSGIPRATIDGQWILDERAWAKFVKSKGDWSAVKVPIITNSPVPGFEEYAKKGRDEINNRDGWEIFPEKRSN